MPTTNRRTDRKAVNNYTENDIVDIQLDVDEDAYHNRNNRGLLDLIKLRKKNKSFFDEDSTTNRLIDKSRTRREATQDTNNSIS